MKNRLNFVAAARAEVYATFFLCMINTPIWQLAKTRRVQITLIKYKNLWFAYYECRRQRA